jgi:8-oxo-dGTP pyrophosphatase MutT (NUDIX family)
MPSIELIVRGVCVVRGALLLCQSRKGGNTYLPGGHIEFREQARAALEREIAEELGLPSRAGRFLGAVEHTFVQKGKPKSELNLLFALQIPGLTPATPPPAREDQIQFCWAPLARLRPAHLEPAVLVRALPRWWRTRQAGFASTAAGWCQPAPE